MQLELSTGGSPAILIEIIKWLISPISVIITAFITWKLSSINQKIALNAQREQFDKQRKIDIGKWEKQKIEERKRLICSNLITNKLRDLKELYGLNNNIYNNLEKYIIQHHEEKKVWDDSQFDSEKRNNIIANKEKTKEVNKKRKSDLRDITKPVVKDFINKINLSKIWFDEEEFNKLEECSNLYSDAITYIDYDIIDFVDIMKFISPYRNLEMPKEDKFKNAYITIQKLLIKKLEIDKLNEFLRL